MRVLFLVWFLYGFDAAESTQCTKPENPTNDSKPFLLSDLSLTWMGSLGFDVWKVTQLQVRTFVTVRWERDVFKTPQEESKEL